MVQGRIILLCPEIGRQKDGRLDPHLRVDILLQSMWCKEELFSSALREVNKRMVDWIPHLRADILLEKMWCREELFSSALGEENKRTVDWIPHLRADKFLQSMWCREELFSSPRAEENNSSLHHILSRNISALRC